jgi:hypothetical protein
MARLPKAEPKRANEAEEEDAAAHEDWSQASAQYTARNAQRDD